MTDNDNEKETAMVGKTPPTWTLTSDGAYRHYACECGYRTTAIESPMARYAQMAAHEFHHHGGSHGPDYGGILPQRLPVTVRSLADLLKPPAIAVEHDRDHWRDVASARADRLEYAEGDRDAAIARADAAERRLTAVLELMESEATAAHRVMTEAQQCAYRMEIRHGAIWELVVEATRRAEA